MQEYLPEDTDKKRYRVQRIDFDLFKSNVCHRLKELGDLPFVVETLESRDIRDYYERAWYPESFYLLAMLDYLSRLHHLPLCTAYADIRQQRLSRPLFPSSVLALDLMADSTQAQEDALQEAIPEFLHFNLVECEIRDIV